MKLIKSNRNYRLGDTFGYIAEFDWQPMSERLRFGQMCQIFERRFGPSHTTDGPWGSTNYNPRWRRELNARQRRQRIYFKSEQDWTWALMQQT